MRSAILLVCLSAALAAQTIEGDVYDRLTGAPLAGVSIAQMGAANPLVVRTDAGGHFRMGRQAAYSLQATHAGYLSGGVTILPSQGTAPVRVELTPQAVITGKLEDEDGFPVERAQVEARRYQTVDGARKLVMAGWAQSDDCGEYRVGNLPAGRYFVHVSPGNTRNWDVRYASQYVGGSLQPDDNHAIEVAAGDERKGVDIRLMKFEGVTLAGRVEGIGAGQVSRPLTLQGSDQSYYASGVRVSDGTWTIPHVPPGSYTLRYLWGNNPVKAGDLVAEMAVEVEAHDLRGLVLTPHQVQGVDVEGKIAADSGAAPGLWQIAVRGSTGSGPTAHSSDDGSFVLKGLLPGHYQVQVLPERIGTPGAGAMTPYSMPISAKLGEKEVLRPGFDLDGTSPGVLRIRLGKLTHISGAIVDTRGAPIAGATLVFLSTQPGGQGFAITDEKGTFSAALPMAGDYHAYMANEASQGGEEEYLKAHEKDFPLLRVVDGDNPPVMLVWRGGK